MCAAAKNERPNPDARSSEIKLSRPDLDGKSLKKSRAEGREAAWPDRTNGAGTIAKTNKHCGSAMYSVPENGQIKRYGQSKPSSTSILHRTTKPESDRQTHTETAVPLLVF
ncbi:hypothetical protein IRJ41_019678 [Triplophysa rosa]|uniref:Uncharacterized protein n=1 Tax=Triplophysa rosa TaxID=992332 RepID=A0A9W7WFZ0_TRIRA|nr:hypothetical protein IRJ41_019678 [Triplophysa rosa]